MRVTLFICLFHSISKVLTHGEKSFDISIHLVTGGEPWSFYFVKSSTSNALFHWYPSFYGASLSQLFQDSVLLILTDFVSDKHLIWLLDAPWSCTTLSGSFCSRVINLSKNIISYVVTIFNFKMSIKIQNIDDIQY